MTCQHIHHGKQEISLGHKYDTIQAGTSGKLNWEQIHADRCWNRESIATWCNEGKQDCKNKRPVSHNAKRQWHNAYTVYTGFNTSWVWMTWHLTLHQSGCTVNSAAEELFHMYQIEDHDVARPRFNILNLQWLMVKNNWPGGIPYCSDFPTMTMSAITRSRAGAALSHCATAPAQWRDLHV